MSPDIAAMQREHEERLRGTTRWIIAETAKGFEIHEWTAEGVAPWADKETREAAAARLLQLMGIRHAIIPQAYPESVQIGSITEANEEDLHTMTDWPQYESHKVVRAARISDIQDVGGTLTIFVKPFDDHTVETFVPTHADMIAEARVGGWAILYPDGFRSISPRKAFEEGYTRK